MLLRVLLAVLVVASIGDPTMPPTVGGSKRKAEVSAGAVGGGKGKSKGGGGKGKSKGGASRKKKAVASQTAKPTTIAAAANKEHGGLRDGAGRKKKARAGGRA